VFKGRINWRVEHRGTDKLAVTAFAHLADSGEEVSFTCDLPMAKAEGWTKNPKYNSMPEVMLRYRSAAFLVRFYAPDVMLGYHTADEWEDVAAAGKAGPVIDVEAKPLTAAMLAHQAGATVEHAETVTQEETISAEQVQEAEVEPVAEQSHDDELPGALSEAAEQTLAEIDGPLEAGQAEAETEAAEDDEPPFMGKVREIRAAIDKCLTIIDLNNLAKEQQGHVEALPDDWAEAIKRDFAAVRARLTAPK
jgi:hypothetical protein